MTCAATRFLATRSPGLPKSQWDQACGGIPATFPGRKGHRCCRRCCEEERLSTRAVRGAIRGKENSAPSIQGAAVRLVREVLASNEIAEKRLVSIIFSLTDDLTASNPATGLRTAGFAATPLFCVSEARVDGSMPGILRVLVTWNSSHRRPAVPVYLDGA